MRALAKSPESREALFAEIDLAAGADARLDAHVRKVRGELARRDDPEPRARRIVEGLALALQGSLLVRHAPAAIADAFCGSRLAGEGGLAFGTLASSVDARAIVARHDPAGM